MIDDELKIMLEKLMESYDKAYNIYKPQVKMIIDNKIQDIDYIERVLDNVLDIYTEKGFYLFIELLLYYRTINYENALVYLNVLQEIREEEYDDFIKKKVKINKL